MEGLGIAMERVGFLGQLGSISLSSLDILLPLDNPLWQMGLLRQSFTTHFFWSKCLCQNVSFRYVQFGYASDTSFYLKEYLVVHIPVCLSKAASQPERCLKHFQLASFTYLYYPLAYFLQAREVFYLER